MHLACIVLTYMCRYVSGVRCPTSYAGLDVCNIYSHASCAWANALVQCVIFCEPFRPTSYAEYLATKGAAGETGLEELYQANLWKKGQDAMKDAAATKA